MGCAYFFGFWLFVGVMVLCCWLCLVVCLRVGSLSLACYVCFVCLMRWPAWFSSWLFGGLAVMVCLRSCGSVLVVG